MLRINIASCFVFTSVEFWLLILFGLPNVIMGQRIITPPSNATGLIGESVWFECEIEFGAIRTMSWDFNSEPVYAYQYGLEDHLKSREKYNVTQDGETFRITVDNLDFDDGGYFTCSMDSAKQTASLIVLDTPKIHRPLGTQLDGQTNVYICEGCFGGPPTFAKPNNCRPELTLSTGVSTGVNPDEGQTFYLEPKRQGNYYLLVGVVVVPIEAKINGSQLHCDLRTHCPDDVVSIFINIDILESESSVQTQSLIYPVMTNPPETSTCSPFSPLSITNVSMFWILVFLGLGVLCLIIVYILLHRHA